MANWLDDDEMRAWRGLIEVFSDVRASLDSELMDRFDITEGDYGVLVLLSETAGNRSRMCDLASRLHLTPGGLTRRLDGLVSRGLVRRETSDEDRRVVLAALTDEGMALLEQAAPVHVAGVRHHLLDHLGPEQVRAVADAFDSVRHARLSEEPATP